MALTPSRQRNAVSEGMALGPLMGGRNELPFDKMALDLSFGGAWRNWPNTNRFKQVSTDLRNVSDGVWMMFHADKDKHVLNLYWDTDMRAITICARGYWQGNEVDADVVAQSIDGDLPAEAWEQLAEAFLSRFERS